MIVALIGAMLASAAASTTTPALAQEGEVYPMVFPVAGNHSYSNSWGAPRSGGRTHKGIDIFAAKGTPVVAVADGTVIRIAVGPRAGRFMVLRHEGGWTSWYLHLNNDTEGTDDGLGGAPAEGIAVGVRVEAGDVIDFVGDSGNAEETPSHLHFEVHHPNGDATNPYPHLRAAEGRPLPPGTTPIAIAASKPSFTGENVTYLGNSDPGGGFATDVTVHNDVAYLGTWGRQQACPGSGVRMIDVSDPTEPSALQAIAAEAEFPGTSTESVWVGSVDTASFTGDLAVVTVRLCDTSERSRLGDSARGVAIYDVTAPTAPILIGTYDSGEHTQGVHEIDVVTRPDGSVLAAVTVLQSIRHTNGALGDLRIIDLTDPTAPVEIADWDLRRDGPAAEVEAMLSEVYDDLELHSHSASWSEDGTGLWVANWDGGVTLLDTTDPAHPAMTLNFGFDPESEGNAHSVVVDVAAGLLIRNDQDLINDDYQRHQMGWGGQRFYDISDPANVVELTRFMTERSMSDSDGAAIHVDGKYSAHNSEVVDGIEYVAWYSDGVRIVDVTNPTDPVELGYFIPPARPDPQGYWKAPDGTTSLAMVWGVHVSDGLIYVSDMNTGLWIVSYNVPAKDMGDIEVR